jgi:hypothetical protein
MRMGILLLDSTLEVRRLYPHRQRARQEALAVAVAARGDSLLGWQRGQCHASAASPARPFDCLGRAVDPH